MNTTINATDLARRLSDVLNRVRYRGERFIIDRNGEPTAILVPIEPTALTMREFVQRLEALPAPDPDFAGELEVIQATQPLTGHAAWPN